MKKMITIRAVAGRTVRDPITRAVMPGDWVTKEDAPYWQKRIATGDVELKPVAAPSVQRVKEVFAEKTKYFEEVKKDD